MLALLLFACPSAADRSLDSDPATPTPPWSLPDPTTVQGHAAECAAALGPIPGFDCVDDGLPVPVTVDGAPVTEHPDRCDKPSALEASCNPTTRAGRIDGRWPDGSPRPGVTFVFTCRSSDIEPPTEASGIYHDVAMIGHDAASGATCYFQSFPTARSRAFPPPGDPGSEAVWLPPADTAYIACHRCHGADPWIHSPWIDQLQRPGSPGQPLVPYTVPGSPYHVLGQDFASWKLEHLAPEGNACLACHRIGAGEGCSLLVGYATGHDVGMPLTDWARTWPGSHWMPPDGVNSPVAWESAWGQHADQLLACCADPELPACRLSPVPPH